MAREAGTSSWRLRALAGAAVGAVGAGSFAGGRPVLSTGYFQEEKLSPLDFGAGPGAAGPGGVQSWVATTFEVTFHRRT